MARPASKPATPDSFGARLAALRQEQGFTQAELGAELDISQRMVAYYEAQADRPPAALLTELARVLNVTTDALLGVTTRPKRLKVGNSRFLRRLQAIEKLDPNEKRQVLQLIDAFIERGQLKRKVLRQAA